MMWPLQMYTLSLVRFEGILLKFLRVPHGLVSTSQCVYKPHFVYMLVRNSYD